MEILNFFIDLKRKEINKIIYKYKINMKYKYEYKYKINIK